MICHCKKSKKIGSMFPTCPLNCLPAKTKPQVLSVVTGAGNP